MVNLLLKDCTVHRTFLKVLSDEQTKDFFRILNESSIYDEGFFWVNNGCRLEPLRFPTRRDKPKNAL